MPVPKEQPPRKLSGPEDRRCRKNLERSRPCPGRRRDNDLRQKDRWGIAGLTCWVGSWGCRDVSEQGHSGPQREMDECLTRMGR